MLTYSPVIFIILCIISQYAKDGNIARIFVIFIQACYARVLDYRRKFIEAAQRYHELSFKTAVDEAQRQAALEKTLICTILASAGKIWYDPLRHPIHVSSGWSRCAPIFGLAFIRDECINRYSTVLFYSMQSLFTSPATLKHSIHERKVLLCN